jgi:hypothetical protein
MPYKAPTWRVEERRRFIDVLVETGNPAVAAAAIGQSLASAYAMRDRSAGFAFQWQRALGVAWEQVENRVLANLLDGAATNIDAKVALEMLKRRPAAAASRTPVIIDALKIARVRNEIRALPKAE